jgi:hypothetical protein
MLTRLPKSCKRSGIDAITWPLTAPVMERWGTSQATDMQSPHHLQFFWHHTIVDYTHHSVYVKYSNSAYTISLLHESAFNLHLAPSSPVTAEPNLRTLLVFISHPDSMVPRDSRLVPLLPHPSYVPPMAHASQRSHMFVLKRTRHALTTIFRALSQSCS